MSNNKKSKRESKDVRFAEPDVRHAEPDAVGTRGPDVAVDDKTKRPHLYWPKDVKRPDTFARQRPAVPCPSCDRLETDAGSRAVVCDRGVSEVSGKAYLTCRVCRHQFAMPLYRGPAS